MSKSASKVTVSSLAKELKLSTCTVSKILNRSFDGFTYAPETIRRVESTARRRGYVPNAYARSLRTKKSMTIGLVVPSGIPYFSGTLVENIERELRPLGYETIVGHSTDNVLLEEKLIRTMIGKGVDALLWIPHGSQLRPQNLGVDQAFPLVILDRPGCSDSHPTVITDNETASRELASRIRQEGHDRLIVLTSKNGDTSIAEREAGIREVFPKGLTELVALNEIADAKETVTGIAPKLKGNALVCLTQNLALGALASLLDNELIPGADVGFASFDDLPLCEIWQPSLTRIQQNLDLLAKASVQLALEKAQNPASKQPLEVRIPANLIWGDSILPGTRKTSAKKRSPSSR